MASVRKPGSGQSWRRSWVAAPLAVAAFVAGAGPSAALELYLRAESLKPTGMMLCPPDSEASKREECTSGRLGELARRTATAFAQALARARPLTAPLLKRDQVWFKDIADQHAEAFDVDPDSTDPSKQSAMLMRRVEGLEAITAGLGRPAGLEGRWLNVFGSVAVTIGPGGVLRVAVDTASDYGRGEEGRLACRATAELTLGADGWASGEVVPVDRATAAAGEGERTPASAGSPAAAPASKPVLRIRQQGETLRVVAGDDSRDLADSRLVGCNAINQLTGSYFPAGAEPAPRALPDRTPAAPVRPSPPFTAPSFDCSAPQSATDEEVCADPVLAENDRRLNAAWSAQWTKLDATMRRLLIEDQRGWVGSLSRQYPQFLHPAWDKQRSSMHFTALGRDKVARLQRERIAVLEGLEPKRQGLLGLWVSHTAILHVRAGAEGGIEAAGWKWEQGDWKAGCEYEMRGKVVRGAFVAGDRRVNPDTLERDGATLIVNRQDDAFSKRRTMKDGEIVPDEHKCRRNITLSSTVRLFPVRPSPDVDNLGGSIR